MPKISVLVPTMRLGGLDIIHHSLKNQTFQDFELVLVDALADKRRIVADKVQHLEPVGNRFPSSQYCRAMNTGLKEAKGEIILLQVDYTYMPPNCLEKHVRVQEQFGEETVVMGCQDDVRCPGLHPGFPTFRNDGAHYSTNGIDMYAHEVLHNGALIRDYGWTIFDKNFEGIEGLIKEERFGSDPRCTMQSGDCDSIRFLCRNESVRREHLIAINGFNEDLDGSHGYQDSDMATRLKWHGLRFVVDPSNKCTIVNPRPYFPHAKRERPISGLGDSNETVWKNLTNKRCARGLGELP